MTATGDDHSASEGQKGGKRTLIDITSSRLIDLVDSRDPKLIASVRQLGALLDRSAQVRHGWQSAITEE